MKVRTIVAYPRAAADERDMRRATSSVVLAGQECLAEPVDTVIAKALDDDADFCHIIGHRMILLPSFYEALLTACEHAGVDYACCNCADLEGNQLLGQPTPDQFVVGQILVRQWVLKELGVGDYKESLKRVIAEYRGIHVPHTLIVEVGL